MMYLKRYSWVALIILVVSVFVVCIFPWQRQIDSIMQGVQCRIGDEELSESVSVSVKGVYKQYLIKNNTFEGSIEISGYDYTSDGLTVSLVFSEGYSNVVYLGFQNGNPITKSLGFICATPDFTQLVIGVNEPINADSKNWSGKNGLFICVPAKDRKQALEIAKELFNKSEWLSHTLLK